MSPLFYDRIPVSGFSDLIACCSDRLLAAPGRAMLPLLELMRFPEDGLSGELLHAAGLPSDTAIHIEYRVGELSCEGTPGHTDAMALNEGQSLSIEAKWGEPRYPSVKRWLADGRASRAEALDLWLTVLQERSRRRIQPHDFSDVTYQLIHRAAAACVGGEDAAVVYLVFDDESGTGRKKLTDCRDDLRRFAHGFGSREIRLYLAAVTVSPRPLYARISRLEKGAPETSRLVRRALAEGPLFQFRGIRVRRIGL